ncbi:hypothetical protein E2320_016183 [Naja naja]|nr:hypothetical protein E2320_016183 [Naja naja]
MVVAGAAAAAAAAPLAGAAERIRASQGSERSGQLRRNAAAGAGASLPDLIHFSAAQLLKA